MERMELTVIMKITISDSRITKMFASLFLAVALVGSISVMNNANIAEAKEKMVTITPQKERDGAKAKFEKEKAQYYLRETSVDSPLREIQDNLVAYNSDRLNYNDGKHERWLEPIGIADNTYPHEGSSCAGYTYIKQWYEDQLENYFHEYNIIQYSNTAALLAHEYGHFVNKDSLTWVKGYPKSAQRDDEFGADQMGMELLDKVPEYSMGSMVARATGFQGIYPTSADDFKFLEDWSYGRVKLIRFDTFNCIFTVDGKMFTVGQSHGLGWQDARNTDRTLYLMGQIASCIHHGIWKKSNFLWIPESDYFPNGRNDKMLLLVCDQDSDVSIKILATFDFTEAELKDRTNMKKNLSNPEKDKDVDDFNFIINWPKD